MSVKYKVDNVTTIKDYTIVGSKIYKDRIHNLGHTLLFKCDILPTGQHTLDFELTNISSNAASDDFSLAFDYILYSPSFKSLAELNLNSTFASNTTPTASPSHPIVSPTASITNVSHPRNVGGNVGGVIGGHTIAALLPFALR